MTCECARHVQGCVEPATRLTLGADSLYVCDDCTNGEDSRELTADERPYCLHMDSGAAWHIRDGVNLGRCPTDGCELGH